MKSPAVKQPDSEFGAQLKTFKDNIGSYSTLGLTPAQITAQAADADYYNYVLECQAVIQNDAREWSAWKRLVRRGKGASTPPAAPTLPTPVPPVAPGIETRFRALMNQAKTNANYNEPVGKALGIEGSVQSGPDLTTVTPVLKVRVVGDQVLIEWGWGGNAGFLDMIEIEVDRGDGKGFTLLTYDTTPNYTDTTPFPATPAKWTYRAIYRVADERVGNWSSPVSVMVG